MYLINDTYFNDFEEIPNLNEPDSKAFSELERVIDNECRLFVQNAIGFANQAILDSFLDDGLLPNDPILTPLKWRNLVYGCEYIKNDVTLKWKGIVYQNGTYRGSMLTDLVFYHWLKNKVSSMAGVGEVKASADGAMLINSTQRLVTTWNKFVKQNQSNLSGVYDNYLGSLYGNYGYGFDWDYEKSNNEVSLLQFLSDNETDYPDSPMKRYAIQNQLGW